MERLLRENHCFTYLSARKLDSKYEEHYDTICFDGQNGGSKAEFHLFLTTRDKEEAFKELREDSESPEENYEKLYETGALMKKFATPPTT